MIFITILFIALIGTMIGLTVWKIRATDPNNCDTSVKNNIERTQEFLPFSDIKDGVIHLGNNQYRAILECNSINYNLRTDKEKDIIEMSYQSFLNSLNHPISILVQTRNVDNDKLLKSLSNDIDKAITSFPQLAEYGEVFLKSMELLPQDIDNNKVKKKYIIVPYLNEYEDISDLSEEEKYNSSLKELNIRCQMISDGLSNIGINSKKLNSLELVDLIYSSLHKDEVNQAENIVGVNNDSFLSMIVSSKENKLSDINDEGRLDFIIYETQKRLETELSNVNGVDLDIKERTNIAISTLQSLRDEIAGYYKTDLDKENEIKYF